MFSSRWALETFIGRLGALWLDRSEANGDVADEPVAEDLTQMLTAIAEHQRSKGPPDRLSGSERRAGG